MMRAAAGRARQLRPYACLATAWLGGNCDGVTGADGVAETK